MYTRFPWTNLNINQQSVQKHIQRKLMTYLSAKLKIITENNKYTRWTNPATCRINMKQPRLSKCSSNERNCYCHKRTTKNRIRAWMQKSPRQSCVHQIRMNLKWLNLIACTKLEAVLKNLTSHLQLKRPSRIRDGREHFKSILPTLTSCCCFWFATVSNSTEGSGF